MVIAGPPLDLWGHLGGLVYGHCGATTGFVEPLGGVGLWSSVVIKAPLPAQLDASKKCAIESVRCLAMLKLIHLKLKLS